MSKTRRALVALVAAIGLALGPATAANACSPLEGAGGWGPAIIDAVVDSVDGDD